MSLLFDKFEGIDAYADKPEDFTVLALRRDVCVRVEKLICRSGG